MNHPSRSKPGWLLLLLLLVVAVPVAYWWRTRRDSESKATPVARRPSGMPSSDRVAAGPTPPASIAKVDVAANPGVPSRDVMLEDLKRWVRRRDDREIEIVRADEILDWNGSPSGLCVIATTKPGVGLTSAALQTKLAQLGEKERALRQQIQQAYSAQDRGEVNRLVGQLVQEKSQWVTDQAIVTYKLALARSQPPVTAFWPGLPHEWAKREEAGVLAARVLGPGAAFQQLRRYNDVTAILEFANAAGERAFIDPVRMTEVKLASGQPPAPAHKQRDSGRDARIAAQWDDFLQP